MPKYSKHLSKSFKIKTGFNLSARNLKGSVLHPTSASGRSGSTSDTPADGAGSSGDHAASSDAGAESGMGDGEGPEIPPRDDGDEGDEGGEGEEEEVNEEDPEVCPMEDAAPPASGNEEGWFMHNCWNSIF